MTAALRLENVTKSYGRRRGVIDLNLEVSQGEVFGYLGPNGAGKTTTIRLLLDLLRPTAGRVEVLGAAPSNLGARRRIGYLPGELDLYEDLNGEELLRYFDNLRGGGSLDEGRRLAERLDLDLSVPIEELSKGNKQKVALVQAFMHQPALLVLDEPTASLDPLVQRTFFQMVGEAQRDGATVFLSSHVLSEVERIADRVGMIREGRLVEVEQLEALKAKALRRFEISFAGPFEVSAFANLPNLRDVTADGTVLSCTVIGTVDSLLKAAARQEVVNIVSHGADLEDLFLAYYQSDAHAE